MKAVTKVVGAAVRDGAAHHACVKFGQVLAMDERGI